MVEKFEKIWIQFLRNHWKMVGLCVIGAIVAVIGAILVFLWFVGEAQSIGLVPGILNLWAMGHIIPFVLHLIFWEFVYIGIPVLLALAAIYLLWWKKIPSDERKEYRKKHLFGKRSKATDGGGGISFLVFIVFCIKVYLDGNWGVAIATWKFDYLVYSYLWAIIWIAVIFGIPIVIGVLWWIHHEMKKEV